MAMPVAVIRATEAALLLFSSDRSEDFLSGVRE
jgi:hypothetical protein